MTTTTNTRPPQDVIERCETLGGHNLEHDPPFLSSVRRWTCSGCGSAVLVSATEVRYGSAWDAPCKHPDSAQD